MLQSFKRFMAPIFSGVLCLAAFCGCTSSFDPTALLEGNLNAIYLGSYSNEYLELVDETAENLQIEYEDGLKMEAEFFASYFDINLEACSDDILPQIVELYRNIYSHSSYEIGDAGKGGDQYLVSLTIAPIDIIQKVMDEDVDPFMENWDARIMAGEFDTLSEEEFETLWAQEIIDMVSARLDGIGYLDEETVSIQIIQDEDGYYVISENDWTRVDELIIAY